MNRTFRLSAALALVSAAAITLAACQKAAPNTAAESSAAVSNTAAPAVAPAAAPAATSTDAADVKAFLNGLYAHYKSSKDNNFQAFDANGKEVLDADTIALFKADQKVMKGEVGAIDTDWLCDCQDFNSIVSTVTVQSATPTEAKATSDFHDTEDKTDPPGHDTFDLVKTADGWRIHDMGTRDQPSLRKVLQDEIAHPPKD